MSRLRTAIALVAAAALFFTALSLGQWQTRRAEEKLALQRQWDDMQRRVPVAVVSGRTAELGNQVPLKVGLTGRFDHRFTVWLDNRPNQGRAGFNVVAPFIVDGGDVVLVNRGWAPRSAEDRLRLPEIGEPSGELAIEGLALAQLPRLLDFGATEPPRGWPAIWQNLDISAFERASGLKVVPFVVMQTSEFDDQLVRQWPAPETGVEKHRGYALQWYSLAGLIAVLVLVFGIRAWRKP